MGLGEDRYSSCFGKVAFDSFSAADRIQKRRAKAKDREYQKGRPYRCRWCHQWHIGTKSIERSHRELKRFMERYKEDRP